MKNLTTQQLFGILYCKKISDLQLMAANQNELQNVLEAAMIEAKKRMSAYQVGGIHVNTVALIPAIEEGVAPIDILWSSAAVLSLGFTAMAALIGVIASISLAAGGLIFYLNRKRQLKRIQEQKNFFIMLELKSAVAAILITRMKESLKAKQIPPQALDKIHHHPHSVIDNMEMRVPSILACAGAGFIMTSTLVITYYWGIHELILALEFVAISSGMMSPPGLIVAATLSFILGVVFAYRYYQSSKISKMVANKKDELVEELTDQVSDCDRLKIIVDTAEVVRSLDKTDAPPAAPIAESKDVVMESKSPREVNENTVKLSASMFNVFARRESVVPVLQYTSALSESETTPVAANVNQEYTSPPCTP